jgi:formyl-CoA transferase
MGSRSFSSPGVVPRLTDTPGRVAHRAPHLGEHNAEIFGELGLTSADLESLRGEKVI